MKFDLFKKSTKPAIIVLSVAVFLFVGFLGFGHLAMMNSGGQMSGCLLPTMATVCQMNLLEHINSWQNLFAALTQKSTPSLLSLLLLALLAISIRILWLKGNQFQPPSLLGRVFQNERTRIFAPLKEAYSDGILNPKTF